MSMAFEVTEEDVVNVLRQNREYVFGEKVLLEDLAAHVFEGLDVAEIESAALDADIGNDDSETLDNQTSTAYAVIREKMVRMGVLTQ